MKKTLLLITLIALFSFSALAKNFNFRLTLTTKAGAVTLPAGEYDGKFEAGTLKLVGPKLKPYTVKVKAEETGDAKKANHTEVNCTFTGDNSQRLVSITLAGTTTRLVVVE